MNSVPGIKSILVDRCHQKRILHHNKRNMIEAIYIFRKHRRRRFRAKKVLAMALLLRFKFYLRDRNFLHSAALFPSVREAPWYVLYRDGCDSDLLSAISLTRSSFEYLLSRFKLFYKFKSGPRKRGRPPRVKDHH